MQIYNFGPEELTEIENIIKDCPKLKWVAYDYRTGSYEGEGVREKERFTLWILKGICGIPLFPTVLVMVQK